jgi:hypothetical protein
MKANYGFQTAKYMNYMIQNWLLIPDSCLFGIIMLEPSSITSNDGKLSSGWYPHTRSFFATLPVIWAKRHVIARNKE